MVYWRLLALRFLSTVVGLKIEFWFRGSNPTELPSEGAYMDLLFVADKPGVSTEQVRTES
jgi:hypothetical protein